MRIIKESTIRGFWRMHADARVPLGLWLTVAREARWRNLQDGRSDYPHADGVKVSSGHTVTVFNIAGNKYRLIVSIKYTYGIVYIRDFLTHGQYNKDSWKERH